MKKVLVSILALCLSALCLSAGIAAAANCPSDNNVCTSDLKVQGQCPYTPLPDGTSCGGANTCQAGVCTAPPPPSNATFNVTRGPGGYNYGWATPLLTSTSTVYDITFSSADLATAGDSAGAELFVTLGMGVGAMIEAVEWVSNYSGGSTSQAPDQFTNYEICDGGGTLEDISDGVASTDGDGVYGYPLCGAWGFELWMQAPPNTPDGTQTLRIRAKAL